MHNYYKYFILATLTACQAGNSYKDLTKYNYKETTKVDNYYKHDSGDSYRSNSSYIGHYKIGKPYKIDGKTYYPQKNERYKEVGLASWYGDDFHNKKTANGEVFNKNTFTAAHKTLPLPSVVKVTNLENGKTIILRVNDRGPFVDNRIIDLSEKAAKKIDMHKKGVTQVKVEYLKKETDQLLRELGLKNG